MFDCIVCVKAAVKEDVDEHEQVRAAENENENGTPRAAKSLIAKIKDMALKFTGRQKGSSSTNQREVMRSNDPDSDSDSDSSDSNSEGVEVEDPNVSSAGSNPSRDQNVIIGGTDDTGNQTPRVDNIPPAGLQPAGYEPNQWMSQAEPGVHVTLISLPNGENQLKRIRFDRERFDRWRAQIWWGENYDRVMELYNVRRWWFNNQSLITTPPNSEEDEAEEERDSPVAAWLNNDAEFRNIQATLYAGGVLSFSNVNHEIVGEWIEQDQPGVFVTIKILADGSKELRRVRFSRRWFGNEEAKIWWEANRERIQAEYL